MSYRFQLTYPIEGHTVHKSKSGKRAIKKCCNDYRYYNGTKDGIFGVTDLDTGVEYHFQVQEDRIRKVNRQDGGLRPEDEKPKLDQLSNIKSQIDNLQKNISNLSGQQSTNIEKTEQLLKLASVISGNQPKEIPKDPPKQTIQVNPCVCYHYHTYNVQCTCPCHNQRNMCSHTPHCSSVPSCVNTNSCYHHPHCNNKPLCTLNSYELSCNHMPLCPSVPSCCKPCTHMPPCQSVPYCNKTVIYTQRPTPSPPPRPTPPKPPQQRPMDNWCMYL